MSKQYKIITLAPTCFGSRRNHHQGADLCLAATSRYGFCARRYRRSQCYGGISACCADVRLTVEPLWTVRPHKPYSEVVWRVLATHSIRQFPLHFPSRASPCAITFQLKSTTSRTCWTEFLHIHLN